MKPNWENLIKSHCLPVTRAGVSSDSIFTLRREVVSISIKTRSAGSGRPPRGRGRSFLFQRTSVPAGVDRITLDLSHEDFLIFQRTEAYSVGGQTQLFGHKHCIPWDNIAEIEFIEGIPAPR
jgi:hypothetical protein